MTAESILRELLECRRIAAQKFVAYDDSRKLKSREKAAWRAAEELFHPKQPEPLKPARGKQAERAAA